MGRIKFRDRANEFRATISGKFIGELVSELERAFQRVRQEQGGRRMTVDITHISGYDLAGRKLLQELHHHGVRLAAGTPLSLVFLQEISIPLERIESSAERTGVKKREGSSRLTQAPAPAGD
ncbi:MAG: hypothetical protein JO108_21400 [Acidobacteriaceae bacterium]|nr:hypothetical protein [Acidobacteriaceae bacterium]